MKIKSKFIFQIDIQNQIDLYFYFHIAFHLLSSLISRFIEQGQFKGLRQLLASESPFKMMKIAFYFTSKALFVLKTFKFLY